MPGSFRCDISIESSTDMRNWAPGEYLGTSNQRFFRVKAVLKQPTALAAPEPAGP